MLKKALCLMFGAALTAALPSAADAAPDLNELSAYSGVSVDELNAAIGLSTFQPTIIKTMTRPYESKPWWQYRKLFITTSRINAGLKFYLAHEETLKRAERDLGVPPEIVCAIIGVETFYGRNMGTWSVLDALFTLGFNYPPRESYFSKEFANYVKLATREGWQLQDIKGSYAGAMGMGQFMPSSYLDYAIDFDGDGHVNLFDNTTDAIGSVANYFKGHGWAQGRGIYYPALVPADQAKALMDKDWELTGRELYAAGVSTKVNLSLDEKMRLFSYQLEDGSTGYGVGLNNFHTIMKYNKSPLYARAVYELSEFIRMAYNDYKAKQGLPQNPQGRVP